MVACAVLIDLNPKVGFITRAYLGFPTKTLQRGHSGASLL
nr:hypothetical protein [Providencia sp.]UNJ80074.1 hypothetical protein [Providencia sp.]